MAVPNVIQYFGLLFLLWNARGLQANLLEFQNLIFKKKPQVICVSETWLGLIYRVILFFVKIDLRIVVVVVW